MASTVGHALAGVALHTLAFPDRDLASGRPDWPAIGTFAALANLPDIDLVVGLVVHQRAHWGHGEATHSLAFAALAGLMAALCYRVTPGFWRSARLYAAVVASHVVIDVFTSPEGPGLSPGPGVALFFPLSAGRVASSLALFWGPRHRTLDQLLSLSNVWVVVSEVLVFVPTIGALLWLNRTRRRG